MYPVSVIYIYILIVLDNVIQINVSYVKKKYSKENLTYFNEIIKKHYNSAYSSVFQIFFCLIYFIGFTIIFFLLGFTIISIGYGVGYFFSCINQFIDKGTCDKNFFEGSHLYIGLFILGIILACRSESKERQFDRPNLRR